jgi:hypothetical protein
VGFRRRILALVGDDPDAEQGLGLYDVVAGLLCQPAGPLVAGQGLIQLSAPFMNDPEV